MGNVFLDNMAWQHAQSNRVAQTRASKNGHWYARLIAHDPRIVQSFHDHEMVAAMLKDAGELQSLFNVACGGLLDSPDSRVYRKAYNAAVAA
jgi:hypothetical protein